MLSKEQAQQLADRLAARLGAAWQPYIHENLGWHAEARLTPGLFVTVNVGWGPHQTTFSMFLDHPGANHPGGIWAVSAPTPEESIRLTLATAQREVDYKTAAIKSARDALASNERATWEVRASVT